MSTMDTPVAPISPADEETVQQRMKTVRFAGGDPMPQESPGEPNTMQMGISMVKKKKRKSKSKMKKGQSKPHGFEEYYVDPPVSPEDFTLEQSLYHPSKPFEERIQTAIQRYSARRKFDEQRRHLWVKYLKYGGIDANPKQFTGGDDFSDSATADDIQTLKATEVISEDVINDGGDDGEGRKDYVVDFNGVLQGFFSLHLPSAFDMYSEEAVKTYVGIIRNWLNYLLHHDVCTEHNEDIHAARRTCDQAQDELWKLRQANDMLPGSFNKACSVIYHGHYRDRYLGDQEWARDEDISHGMGPAEADRIFLAALASNGSDELCDIYSKQNEDGVTRTVNELETGLEVIEILPPSHQVRQMYSYPTQKGLSPVGRIKVRTWYRPWEPEEDLTKEEEEDLPRKRTEAVKDYEIWVDDGTLSKMFVGMKMIANVKELSFGLWFLDKVTLTFCSFALFLPNELMQGWRKHEYLPPPKKGGDQTYHAEEDPVEELTRGEEVIVDANVDQEEATCETLGQQEHSDAHDETEPSIHPTEVNA